MSEIKIPILIVGGADYIDSTGAWTGLREIEDGGIGETTNAADDLAAALSSILSR